MPKFKAGDRVRMISHDASVPFGTVGTVVLIDSHAPYVEWDNWNNGHSAPFYDGRETVLAAFEGNLELAPPEEALPAAPQETLRDRMAMAAISGLVASSKFFTPKIFAEDAYKIADAMLKEREGK